MTPWTAALQVTLSFTVSQSLLKFMSIESVMPSNRLILCHPLLLLSILPSIRVFSNELALSLICIPVINREVIPTLGNKILFRNHQQCSSYSLDQNCVIWIALAAKESVQYRFLAGYRLFKRKTKLFW